MPGEPARPTRPPAPRPAPSPNGRTGSRPSWPAGDWETLDAELEGIREREPDLYAWYRLGYLHGRVKLAAGEHAEARRMLEPFLAAGHPLRDLALHYAAAAEEAAGNAEEAARLREDLILNHRQGNYRLRALEDHVEWLTEQKDVTRLRALMGRLPSDDAAAVRDIESRIVVLTLDADRAGAVAAGMRLLKANQGDDAAERVARALDRPEILDALQPADWVLLGESARSHRHYDRAVVLLERALQAGAGKRDDLLYSIGRAHFGAEQYEAAEKRYLEGAAVPSSDEVRGNFFYNAARSAQLAGDDARAERHLADAIRAGGKTSRASSALTQRLRIRVRAGRHAEARADLAAVRKTFAKTHARGGGGARLRGGDGRGRPPCRGAGRAAGAPGEAAREGGRARGRVLEGAGAGSEKPGAAPSSRT